MSDFIIRSISWDDYRQWVPMWQSFFAFHGGSISPEVTSSTFDRLCDPKEPMHALVAARASDLVGFVTYIFHPDTVTIGPICYLKNLFTREDARGQGIGRALILTVYAEATRHGAERVTWNVREDNVVAMRLYNSLATRTGFVQYPEGVGSGDQTSHRGQLIRLRRGYGNQP